MALIWWTGRLPLPVPDFHELRHHHESAESCVLHEHLNRWHTEANLHELASSSNLNHAPLLHWHWLLPGWAMPENDQKSDGTGKPSGSHNHSDSFVAILTTYLSPNEDAFSWLVNETSNVTDCLLVSQFEKTAKKHIELSLAESCFRENIAAFPPINHTHFIDCRNLKLLSLGFVTHLRC